MSARVMFSLFNDNGVWVAVCDRCALEFRVTPTSAAFLQWERVLFEHDQQGHDEVVMQEDAEFSDIGHDEDVEPLAGALSDSLESYE